MPSIENLGGKFDYLGIGGRWLDTHVQNLKIYFTTAKIYKKILVPKKKARPMARKSQNLCNGYKDVIFQKA